MKLLYICHHRKHKTFRAGGFARQMAGRGHEVTVLCIADTRRWTLREYVEEGVRYVEAPDLLPGALRSGWDPWDMWRRQLYLRGRAYDLIHAFESRPATIHPVRSLLRRGRVPLVMDWVDWWGRGGLIKEHRPRWYQWLCGGVETYYEEHFRGLADGTTVISRGLAERAQSLGVAPETIYWIPSAADVSRLPVVPPSTHRTAFGLPAGAFLLGFSALDVTLGFELVLDAVQQVVQRHPETFLVLTGKQSTALARAVTERSLAAHVRHLGFLPYGDYQRLMTCVDVFLLPFVDTVANRGRWPGRIRDYMAAARPVISNPVGEMGRLLAEHDIGALAGENAVDMAEKIDFLRAHPEVRERQGATARRLAEQRFSMEKITDDLALCYRETWDRFRAAARASR